MFSTETLVEMINQLSEANREIFIAYLVALGGEKNESR